MIKFPNLSAYDLTLFVSAGELKKLIIKGNTAQHRTQLESLGFIQGPGEFWQSEQFSTTESDTQRFQAAFKEAFPLVIMEDASKESVTIKLVRGIDLSVYGLRVFLTAEPDEERAKSEPFRQTNVMGQTENHTVALTKLGFQAHANGRYWFKSGRVQLDNLRSEFPQYRVSEFDARSYIVKMKAAPAAVVAPSPVLRDLVDLRHPPAPELKPAPVVGSTTVVDVVVPAKPEKESAKPAGESGKKAAKKALTAIRRETAEPIVQGEVLFVPSAEGDFSRGKEAQVKANLAAIELLAQMDPAAITDSDKNILSRYAGWGGLPEVFDTSGRHYTFRGFQEQLRELVTPEQFDDLESSILNAHFTPQQLMTEIWSALGVMGFDGGRVLEAGCGTGHFIGTMPQAVRQKSSSLGVEKEPISAKIAQALYGDRNTKILHCGYENAAISDDSIDVVVGNVPFGEYQIKDASLSKSYLIHDMFLIKNMNKLRPGGVMAVITSIGTLDKTGSAVREKLYASMDLVAAFRLPSQTQEQTANCAMTTDLLVFRKRLPGEALGNSDWLGSSEVAYGRLRKDPRNSLPSQTLEHWALVDAQKNDLRDVKVNNIYLPGGRGVVLGRWAINTQFATARAFVACTKNEMPSLFASIVQNVPKQIYVSRPRSNLVASDENLLVQEERLIDLQKEVFGLNQVGHYVVLDEVLGQLVPVFRSDTGRAASRAASVAQAASFDAMPNNEVSLMHSPLPINDPKAPRIRAMIPLRDSLLACLRAQLDGCSDMDLAKLQSRALAAYKDFTAKFGAVGSPQNRKALKDDPDATLVFAAEYYDQKTKVGEPAEIFSQRTLSKSDDLTAIISAHDAMLTSVANFGYVRQMYVEKRTGLAWPQAREELGDKILWSPVKGHYQAAPLMLSGDIGEKILAVTNALETANDDTRAEIENTLERLQSVMPRPLTHEQIPLHPGAPWIPVSVVDKFFDEVIFSGFNVKDRYTMQMGYDGYLITEKKNSDLPITEWDVKNYPVREMFEDLLNSKQIRLTVVIDDGVSKFTVLDAPNTELARYRARRLTEMFIDWAMIDEERQNLLCGIYNKTFNSSVPADFSTLSVPISGLSLTRPFRDFQLTAVVRNILTDTSLCAHPPGAGKTGIAVGTAMKLKELGIALKSLICVKKNTVAQYVSEARRFFPSARVLALENNEFTPAGRANLLRRLQTQNPDIIIITPEILKRIAIPREFEIQYLEEIKDELDSELKKEAEAIRARGGKPGKGRTAKAIRLKVEKAANRRKGLLDGQGKDALPFTLADMGVGMLFADEWHNFKNITVASKQNVLGIPTNASQRAEDLLMKTRYLKSTGLKFCAMSGTPIANSLAEAWVISTFLQPDELERKGIASFDAWCRVFAEVVTKLEPDAGSGGYRSVSRLATIVGVPELVRMIGQVTETVSEARLGFVRPTPSYHVHTSHPTPLQEGYRELLSVRTRLARMSRKAEKGSDNILSILGDSRRASMDLRALFPNIPASANPGAKFAGLVDLVAEIAARDAMHTQLIFCDFATPGSKTNFNAYEEIRGLLVAKGMRREQIEFIHDAKTDAEKDRLFERVRSSTTKLLIGSTEKMGEGTNVQNYLKAVHHVTVPWNSAAITQRNGRAIRFGNLNGTVEIHTHVTDKILEDWGWGLVNMKQKFTNDVMLALAHDGRIDELKRSIAEDTGAMDFAEIEAAASGNPEVKERCGLEADIQTDSRIRQALGMRKRSLETTIYYAEDRFSTLTVENRTATKARDQLMAAFKDPLTLAAKSILNVAVLPDSYSFRSSTPTESPPFTEWTDLANAINERRYYNEKTIATVENCRIAALQRSDGTELKFYPISEEDSWGKPFCTVNLQSDAGAMTRQIRHHFALVLELPNTQAQIMQRIADEKPKNAEGLVRLSDQIEARSTSIASAQIRLDTINAKLVGVVRDPRETDAAAMAFVQEMARYGYSPDDLMKAAVVESLVGPLFGDEDDDGDDGDDDDDDDDSDDKVMGM